MTVGDTFHAFTSRIERGASMSKVDEREYWVPEHVRDYLRSMGFTLPLEAMGGTELYRMARGLLLQNRVH